MRLVGPLEGVVPHYKGVPVPHVALWEGESALLSPKNCGLALHPVTGKQVLCFDPEDEDDRDDNGVLWMPEQQAIGEGKPLFSQLNGRRQRDSLLASRCQVCDDAMYDNVTFLLPMLHRASTDMHTTTAPVCLRCQPIAIKYCPHLQSQPMLCATVPEPPTMSGYVGDWVKPDGSFEKFVTMQVGDSRLPTFLAKQAVGHLRNITWSPCAE